MKKSTKIIETIIGSIVAAAAATAGVLLYKKSKEKSFIDFDEAFEEEQDETTKIAEAVTKEKNTVKEVTETITEADNTVKE